VNTDTIIPAGTDLRTLLIELHGEIEGTKLFHAAQKERERTARFAGLQEDLAAVRAAGAAEIALAEQRLAEWQQETTTRYHAWVSGCDALERAKIELQQAKNRLDRNVRALHDEYRAGPKASPHALQWVGAPSWHKPEPDIIRETETAEERRERQEKEWASTLTRSPR
jgi:hypothetical protein